MGSAEVESFLSHLATERHVAPSTHKQALAALLFLYRQVLDIDLPWMQQIGRPKSPVRIPVVLSRVEVARLLDQVEPTFSVMVASLYGAGLRLMECLRLRVHWVFPSPTLSLDPRSGIRRRHHQYEQTVGRAIARAVGHSDVSTTMIYTHVLSSSAAGTRSPLESLPCRA